MIIFLGTYGKCGFPTHCRDSTPTTQWMARNKNKADILGFRLFNYPNNFVHLILNACVMQCKNKCINETLINVDHQNDKKFGPVLVKSQALYTERYGTTRTCGIKIHPNFYAVTCHLKNIKAFEEPCFSETLFI